ncbi:MAG: hypothetical protein ACD_51C00361G0009 [uncultured bacterium]|nr:MAG: hypothetical protein ACD_51C00361G0009 [uncultured bacterium]
MSNYPRTITLINKNTSKRRIIHLITQTKEKSFKSASAKCKAWVSNNGFPIVLKVCYGNSQKSSNEMDCNCIEELRYGLQAFVKEYLE